MRGAAAAILLGAVASASLLLGVGLRWMWPANDLFDLYLRSTAFVTGTFVALTALPVLAKWLLVGRWKPQEIRSGACATSASGSSGCSSGRARW